MFFVVGLTLEDISTGALPQVCLADALHARRQGKHSHDPTQRVIVYTTDGNDTQGLIARTKYKEMGAFLVFLYFNEMAVRVCNELGVPLRILDRMDERGLPAKRVTVLEHPYVAPAPR